jgi:hypothetical protein
MERSMTAITASTLTSTGPASLGFKRIASWLLEVWSRSGERRRLSAWQSLDPRFARDIGLTAEMLDWESRKSPWRGIVRQ